MAASRDGRLAPPPGSVLKPLQDLGRPTLPPATDGQQANALLSRYLFMAESLGQGQDDPCPENIPLTAGSGRHDAWSSRCCSEVTSIGMAAGITYHATTAPYNYIYGTLHQMWRFSRSSQSMLKSKRQSAFRVRSRQPISRSALARAFCRGQAASRHSLVRAVFHGKPEELRQRYREDKRSARRIGTCGQQPRSLEHDLYGCGSWKLRRLCSET